ncbi:DnaA-like protein [Dysgonomonas alginatilytica]|uniref:DnaA-like protein n=1 Tax=Dysgonomonas alginatilytica TaxID=1605892 RepID=A0A2V3PRF0_9BACT|nr:hypothetical protein [Dysgonomonas alginatilytica]PXV66900.1 DnaA-like protein [Dysgonomonas alginatilytica]
MIHNLNDFCHKVNVKPSDLISDSQKQPLPLYRAVFAYLMYPTYTQTEIGKLLNRHPSTINTSINKLKDANSVGDKSVKRVFDQLNFNTKRTKMTRPDLTPLSKKVYAANKEKGFHDHPHPDKHHLCLIVSELMEAVEAHRKGKKADLTKFYYCTKNNTESEHKSGFVKSFNTYIKDTIEDELADAVIRLLDFAGARNYDLNNIAFSSQIVKAKTFTESIWEVITELVACEEEESVYCTISQIEELCNRMFISLWEHVDLKLKYNRTRPYRHNKLY